MKYLYGDSSPFPLDFNFLATLEAFLPPATEVVMLEHEARAQARRNAEATAARLTDLTAAETLAGRMVRAAEAASTELDHPIATRMARHLMDEATRSAQEQRRAMEQANAEDLAQLRADDERRNRQVRTALESFLAQARVPTLMHAVAMTLRDGKNELSAVLVVPGGIVATFGLAAPVAWRTPRRVAEFATGMDLQVGVKKSFFKGTVSADQMHLDDYLVGHFDVGEEEAEIALRRKPDHKDTLIFKVRREGDAVVGEVQHPGDPNADALPSALSPEDLPHVERLWNALREATVELLEHRATVHAVQLDGADAFAEGGALPFVVRLIEVFGPTVRAIAEKSPNEHELSLKIDAEGRRREEVYLRREELLEKLQPLPAAGREVFEPLGLDTWLRGTTLAPPPVAEDPAPARRGPPPVPPPRRSAK